MGKKKPGIRLLDDETLLWAGTPQKRPPYPRPLIGVLCLYVFLMLTTWFVGGAGIILKALLDGIAILDQTWVNISMTVFLLGFLWLGTFINVLRLANRERWLYALTDKRLLMVSRLLGVEIEYSTPIQCVESSQKIIHRSHLTSLAFASHKVNVKSHSLLPMVWLLGISELQAQVAFHSLAADDANAIYLTVDELRANV
ncbi:MAG: hypothetical protein U0694_17040 [Anaerolineae bacterium]